MCNKEKKCGGWLVILYSMEHCFNLISKNIFLDLNAAVKSSTNNGKAAGWKYWSWIGFFEDIHNMSFSSRKTLNHVTQLDSKSDLRKLNDRISAHQ